MVAICDLDRLRCRSRDQPAREAHDTHRARASDDRGACVVDAFTAMDCRRHPDPERPRGTWAGPLMGLLRAVRTGGFAASLISRFLEFAHETPRSISPARNAYPERPDWFLAVLIALVLLGRWTVVGALEEHDRARVAGL